MMVAVLMKDISETGFVLNKITFDGQRIRFSSAIQMVREGRFPSERAYLDLHNIGCTRTNFGHILASYSLKPY